MSRYLKKLSTLLEEAASQNVVDDAAIMRLREMAEDQERSGSVLSLAAVLGWLGGIIMTLGVVLLVGANWDGISPSIKLLCFFVLFLGTHGLGFYFRLRTELVWFPEALNFLGAGLFIAGLGLISQIYQLDVQWPTLFIAWLIAIAPLAWCFRSTAITMLAVGVLVTWLHMEQFSWGTTARNYDFSFASSVAIEVGIGSALIGFAALTRDRESQIALAFRGSGLLLLFYGVYMMGFYRHLSYDLQSLSSLWVPCCSLCVGAIGLVIGFRFMLPENSYLRNRLVLLLALVLGTAAVMLLTDAGVISKGADLKSFNFGWYQSFHLTEWILSIVSWVLWFTLALWCVFFASRTNRRTYLNAGVVGVGIGVITRFFDLMGGLHETGLTFFVGGLVLLVTCFAVEFWRRKIVRELVAVEKNQKGAKA